MLLPLPPVPFPSTTPSLPMSRWLVLLMRMRLMQMTLLPLPMMVLPVVCEVQPLFLKSWEEIRWHRPSGPRRGTSHCLVSWSWKAGIEWFLATLSLWVPCIASGKTDIEWFFAAFSLRCPRISSNKVKVCGWRLGVAASALMGRQAGRQEKHNKKDEEHEDETVTHVIFFYDLDAIVVAI